MTSRRWILAATILGSSMAFIDGTVVNVALPAIQADLRATLVDVQWVVEAYALFLAALLLAGGSLGDRFGRRRVFMLGTAMFAGASVWCGLAPDIRHLIAARAAQGIGGALLVPGSLAILSASFSEGDRGRAIGTWSAFTSITAAAGPVLGGWLIDHLAWRWAFFLNVPIAAAVLLISAAKVPESRDERARGAIDWPGALLATLGLGGVVFALIESSELHWRHPAVLGSLGGGLLFLAAFGVVERRVREPMVPLDLFRSRDFSGANLLTLFLYAALSGVLFFLPLDLIQVQGYTAAAAGASMLPFILLMFLLSRWSGGLFDRIGAKIPLVAGPAVAGAGFVLLALPGRGGSYWTTFFPAMAVLGLGMAVTVAPLTTTVMSSVERRHSGAASGINNAVSRTAGLLAVAVFSVVMLSTFERRLDEGLRTSGVTPQLRTAIESQSSRLAALSIPPAASVADRERVRGTVASAFVAGFRRVILLGAALALIASGTALVLIGRPRRRAPKRH
ncbi:MAG TPA: MFS transporter [Thermoanaerobaculia bacterium]|nr:MFS transporter [Thermoanaerobaculia bacterium]